MSISIDYEKAIFRAQNAQKMFSALTSLTLP